MKNPGSAATKWAKVTEVRLFQGTIGTFST